MKTTPPSQIVCVAMKDPALSWIARGIMLHLDDRLDHVTYRAITSRSLARALKIRDTTARKWLALLILAGYLDEAPRAHPRHARSVRLPWVRQRPSGAAQSGYVSGNDPEGTQCAA